MTNPKSKKDPPKAKPAKKNSKSSIVAAEVTHKPLNGSPGESRETIDLAIVSDSTSVIEISRMQTIKYSENIINHVKSTYNLNELRKLKDDPDKYLEEGKRQIDELWDGIHALNIHTEMFTVLFLIAIGDILNEIAGRFDKPHEFARWRDGSFGPRHRRLFQQAQQLAKMGDFARKYSPMGKVRLLQLEAIRKAEQMNSCEDILKKTPVYDEIEEESLWDELVEEMKVDPFPDISYDMDNERIKHYLNSVITYHRLKREGIDYADFDHATLISEYQSQAIPLKDVKALKKWLEKHDENERPELFDNYVMDRMKTPSGDKVKGKLSVSIDKLVVDLVNYCETNEIGSDEWWEKHKQVIGRDSIKKARDYLIFIISRFEQGHPMESQSPHGENGGIS